MTQHYSDDDLRALRDHVFGAPDEPDDATETSLREEALREEAQEHLVVPREGASPDPGPISSEQYNVNFAKRLFNEEYDQVQQPLPEPQQGAQG